MFCAIIVEEGRNNCCCVRAMGKIEEKKLKKVIDKF